MGSICKMVQQEPVLAVPEGVEVTRRYADGAAFTFVLNHNATETTFSLPDGEHTDALRQAPISGDITLKGRDVVIFCTQIKG